MHEQNRELDTSSSALNPLFAGRYQIKALLGEGGYGTVYRAFDTQLGEEVALKVLRREIIEGPSAPGMPSVLDRFRNEVRLARRVTHPNVARMFDVREGAQRLRRS